MAEPLRIRVISICVFSNADRILTTDGFDSVKNITFHRPLGGSVEPGETSAQAVVREIKEELGLEVEGLSLLDVIENIFTWEGKQGHEIVFVYDGRFTDASAYEQPYLVGVESHWEPVSASWKRLDAFDEHRRLVPEGLTEVLRR